VAKKGADLRSSQSYFEMANFRFMKVANKPIDSQHYSLAMGLLNLSRAQRLALTAIFSHVQRINQKIDRIEKKLGSI
jgi:carbonic anhydrase